MKRSAGELVFDVCCGLLLLSGAVLVALLFVLYLPAALHAERRCLRAGYPGAKMTIALEAYCIRRVDQTDVVVPLEQAEHGR